MMNTSNTKLTLGDIIRMASKNQYGTYNGRYITQHHNITSLINNYNSHLKHIAEFVKEYESYLEQLQQRDEDAEKTLLTIHQFALAADKLIRYQYAMLRDVPVSRNPTDGEKQASENIIKSLRYQLLLNGIEPMI